MPHTRQNIRDNVVTVCTSLTTTAARVYRSRVYPLAHAKLPGLCIYSQNEDSLPGTMTATRFLERTVEIVIEAFVRGTANYDNTLDTIASEIEVAMSASTTRGGYAKDSYLTRTEFEFSDEGDQPIAMARLVYAVEYRTAENNATTAV